MVTPRAREEGTCAKAGTNQGQDLAVAVHGLDVTELRSLLCIWLPLRVPWGLVSSSVSRGVGLSKRQGLCSPVGP